MRNTTELLENIPMFETHACFATSGQFFLNASKNATQETFHPIIKLGKRLFLANTLQWEFTST